MNKRLTMLAGIALLLGAMTLSILFTGCAAKKREIVNNPSVPAVGTGDENASKRRHFKQNRCG